MYASPRLRVTSANVWLVIATSNSRPSIVLSVKVSSSAWNATTDPAIVSEKVKCILESISFRVPFSGSGVLRLEDHDAAALDRAPVAVERLQPAGLRDVVGGCLRGVGEHEPPPAVVLGDGELVRAVVHVHHHVHVRLERLLAGEREREHARVRVAPFGLVELEAVPADVPQAAPVVPAGQERAAAQARVPAAQVDHVPEEPEEAGVLVDELPVEPGEVAVLAVGVVVAVLRPA